jgi:hypothetical protein
MTSGSIPRARHCSRPRTAGVCGPSPSVSHVRAIRRRLTPRRIALAGNGPGLAAVALRRYRTNP